MKPFILFFTGLLISLSFLSCQRQASRQMVEILPYSPVDQQLYNDIVAMDKVFFDAYNNCDLAKQAAIYADDIEFFHDKGGLSTSKQDILAATEKNICGKVTRTLIQGSVEVYPIANYGAVEIGFHKFFNNQEPTAPSTPSKFIAIWKNEYGNWRLAKVVSLH